jgi:hypothetical protein
MNSVRVMRTRAAWSTVKARRPAVELAHAARLVEDRDHHRAVQVLGAVRDLGVPVNTDGA